MLAFLERYIPRPHQLVPVTYDEVYERQGTPGQRALIEASDSFLHGAKRMLKFFIKVEAYAKPTDPRIISTYNTRDKVDFSTFTYAEAEHLKKQPWYLFGKTPCEIAERVAKICQGAKKHVVKSDMSRFDGHVSPALRAFEEMSIIRKFREAYHGQILDLVRATRDLHAVGTLGTAYSQGSARGSGSPDTSIRNSEDNAFAAFVGYKSTLVDGAFMSDDMAYAMMERGGYGGDDGLTVDMDCAAYRKGCAALGLEIKCEPVLRGTMGVVVLSRCFGPDVWYGETNSCSDVGRLMSKFHTCGVLPPGVTAEQKLMEKVRSLACTDAETPIVGDLVRKAMQLGSGVELNGATSGLRSWFADEKLENRFLNYEAGWMHCSVDAAIPSFDFEVFSTWLNSCTTLSDLLTPPLCAVPKRAGPQAARVFVDSMIIDPAPVEAVDSPTIRPRRTRHRDRKEAVPVV